MNHHAPQAAGRHAPANLTARRRQAFRHRPNQQGIALVVALILLIVITLVSLAAARGTIMQQKMTANFYDRQVAFQANEAALRVAQAKIQASTTPPATTFRDCSPEVGVACIANPFDDDSVAVSDVATTDYDAGSIAGAQPQYVVEYLGRFKVPDPTVTQVSNCSGYLPCASDDQADFFRITVRNAAPGTLNNRASVTLQSVFRK